MRAPLLLLLILFASGLHGLGQGFIRPFQRPITARDSVDTQDSPIIIDSYDSRVPEKSTNGLYDPAKRQTNGTVATNGVGSASYLGGASIWGQCAVQGWGDPGGTVREWLRGQYLLYRFARRVGAGLAHVYRVGLGHD